MLEKTGAPDTIRTCGLCLRRAALYPAELRVRGEVRYQLWCARPRAKAQKMINLWQISAFR